ncbi:MAG: carbohydrate binding family 9 domain-containing protein [Gemmatimonadetes bacterium]|nr:carbohydrate binding family 9 domain-containing protein [Gemmatimonadota bacterium]
MRVTVLVFLAAPLAAPLCAQTPVAESAPEVAPAGPAITAERVYSGRAERIQVGLPRVEEPGEIRIDGALDEAVWGGAALLTGFSQYQPQDGLPADDSTDVYVWYSPTAIYFGVRAYEPHGGAAVRAKLADRDKIDSDDHIQLFLDTFNDRRRALYFAVNPLGRQADGILNERSGGGTDAELAEDFQFQSKGRLTAYGYEIEIRIPFKSLRYQALPVQDWGIQVVREVQHSQYTQTWTRARRAGQSFLAQGGRLQGLSQLKRGLVMDVNPVTTAHIDGASAAAPAAGWNYADPSPEVGGNLRWGITTNLTLNATANPDFSQVEADVQQVQYDPRSAVSVPEKRPFFVEGGEQFDAPHSLIYTRRIVQPVAAVKLNGRAARTNIGFLSAVDERGQSATPLDPNNPVFNILRLKRDLGPQSTLGMTYTDRIDGGDWSRVGSVDTRMVFARLYAFTGSYAHAFNRVGGVASDAPGWRLNLDRTGRRFGFSYNVQGTHPAFRTLSGFVNRTDIANASINHRFVWFGKPGARLESHTFGVNLSSNWWYDSLLTLKEPNDPKLHLNNTFHLRGGWRMTANVLIESFRYDPGLYRNYYIERTLAGGARDTVPYVGIKRIQNLDLSASINTPQWSSFRGTFNTIIGRDENFEEWAPAFIFFPTVTIDWTPHPKVRVNLRYPVQLYVRLTDWSTVRRRQIPRLKLEYQATRAVFFRFVGQYDAQFRDDLRDDSRSGFPILLRSSAGTFTRATERKNNNVRVDWLFSYQPNPGTVFFAGYGASLREPEAFRFGDLDRTTDGFFVKASYLFRL